MEIILAAPRGFCAGVNMAVTSLDLAIQYFGTPIYVYHEIVHNQYVVKTFQAKGAVFVDELSEVPEGATVLFSAHGVSPEIREVARTRKLFAIDATCPLVTKVHLEAIKYAKEGYTIILIVLVEDEAGVEQLNFPANGKLAYLTQTTLSVDDATRIILALRERFPWVESPPKEDICYATQNRQEAVRLLSQEAEIVLVIGSQNSSNSQRLRELGREQGKDAFLIDGVEDIDRNWFKGSDRVLLTAGASAPESVVQETVEWLVREFNATVREHAVKEENVHFPLPKPLRQLVKDGSLVE